jgi:quercetin dioxygenase-like cupin family protein
MTIHQELADGSKPTVALAAGDYAINPPGAWHIADVADSAAAVFVMAGWGDGASAAVR